MSTIKKCLVPIFAAFILLTTLPGITGQCFAYQPVTNYRSVIRVNGFIISGDKIWMASSGGLYCYSKTAQSGVLYADTRDFPDLDLTSIYQDPSGTFWIGTRNGYLYRRTASGVQTIFTGNTVDKWGITQIVPHGDLLIMASPKGCSIFDTRKMQAIKNTSRFSTFTLSQVNAVTVFKDTLFLGCPEGTAYLDISSNKLLSTTLNFYDRSIWSVKPAAKPVLSFIRTADSLIPSPLLSAQLGDVIYTASPTRLFRNGDTIAAADSVITCIAPDGNGCWFGTSGRYAYNWTGSKTENIIIPGPTFNSVTALMTDLNGVVWALPPSVINTASPNLWASGISRFDGKKWIQFGQNNTASIGAFGENALNRGISCDLLGNMWFGTVGSNVKHYTQKDTSWQMYCLNTTGFTGDHPQAINSTLSIANPCPDWGACNAICTDSSGYVWLGNFFNFHGSLVCVDPADAPDPSQSTWPDRHYRRFFPGSLNPSGGDPFHMNNTTMLGVMKDGTILAGSELGELAVFRHNGNPLQNGVTQLRWFSSVDQDMGTIYGMTNSTDGTAWLATIKGVFKLSPSPAFKLEPVTNLSMSCLGISAEEPNRLWIATKTDGIVRYDIGEETLLRYNTDKGVPSNSTFDIVVDKSRGFVWAATADGITRIDLGYSPGQESNGSSLNVYPNPLSLTRNTSITFRNAPSGSVITIYSIGGSQLGTAAVTALSSPYGQTYTWQPGAKTVPGTYFYVIKSVNTSSRGKLLIIP